MDAESHGRKQYLAWLAMFEDATSGREGNVSRASRAENRMADLENKVFQVGISPALLWWAALVDLHPAIA